VERRGGLDCLVERSKELTKTLRQFHGPLVHSGPIFCALKTGASAKTMILLIIKGAVKRKVRERTPLSRGHCALVAT
jgi:hypothetical protein